MTITTQKRNLVRQNFPSRAAHNVLGIPKDSDLIDIGDYTKNPTPTVWQPTQETTSYRTDMRRPVGDADPLSEDAIKDFTDVTGNGFKGEFPLTVLNKDQYDNGHEFFTTKTSFHLSHPHWDRYFPSTSAGRYYRYVGPLLPRTDLYSSLYPAASRMSSQDIAYYGPAAIAATAPTAPQASIATSLGELLREGLPSLIGLTTMRGQVHEARSAGSSYLNYQFGWLPLVSDLRSIVKSLAWRSNLIRQFERDGGKRVRRRMTFPNVSTTQTEWKDSIGGPALHWWYSYAGPYAFSSANGGVQPSRVYRENVKSRDFSFSGQFQYAVIEGKTYSDKLLEFEQKANFLLGASLTPETLWNLAPWTWLADWMYNIGDCVSNASYFSRDGLVMRYGYLMCHTREFNRFYIPSHDISFWGGARPGTVSITFTRESKERVRATPYGFAQNPSSFSARQWAILGALGLTKAPKSLH